MATPPAKPSERLTSTSQSLLLILTSRGYYNSSYCTIDLNEVNFDASFSGNQELIVPQLKSVYSKLAILMVLELKIMFKKLPKLK